MTQTVPIEVSLLDDTDDPIHPCADVVVRVPDDWLESLPEDQQRTELLRAYGFVARAFVRAHELLPHRGTDPAGHGPAPRLVGMLGERDAAWLWEHRRGLVLDPQLPGDPADGIDWWYGSDTLPADELRRLLPLLERAAAVVVTETAAEFTRGPA